MRKLDITKENLNCCGDIFLDLDCINITYELWFDVDKYFGTETNSSDDIWVDFFTYWYPDGNVSAVYCLDSDTDYKSYDWELTEEEKKFFLQKMEEYCKNVEDMTLEELWKSYN